MLKPLEKKQVEISVFSKEERIFNNIFELQIQDGHMMYD
jgi:hypothetical protein